MRDIVRFSIVGGLGFLFDAAVISMLVGWVAMDVYLARLLSFASAVVFTWLLNRSFTFKDRKAADMSTFTEYFRYLSVQSVGAGISLAVFFCAVTFLPILKTMPVVPLAMGSATALAFNFLASRRFIYSTRR